MCYFNISVSVVICLFRVYASMVEGITNAVYFKVDSLEVGERALRRAIERSDIVRFPTPLQ